MNDRLVYTDEGFVDVLWASSLQAVHVKWHSEYDDVEGGTRVREGVMAAVAFVNDNDVKNWFVDVSTSVAALKDEDYAWVSSDGFRQMISETPLRRFVLAPPLPGSGVDDSWVADWETNTMHAFGDQIQALVSNDLDEIRKFFCG